MVSAPETFPFMVIGNKLDLEEEARAVSKEDAQKYCDEAGKMEFLETSASKN
jgi:Ras-related protein Rab-7A